MRTVWACQACGYEWPYPPGVDEVCPECGGIVEQVDPFFVRLADTIEAIVDAYKAQGLRPAEPGD